MSGPRGGAVGRANQQLHWSSAYGHLARKRDRKELYRMQNTVWDGGCRPSPAPRQGGLEDRVAWKNKQDTNNALTFLVDQRFAALYGNFLADFAGGPGPWAWCQRHDVDDPYFRVNPMILPLSQDSERVVRNIFGDVCQSSIVSPAKLPPRAAMRRILDLAIAGTVEKANALGIIESLPQELSIQQILDNLGAQQG